MYAGQAYKIGSLSTSFVHVSGSNMECIYLFSSSAKWCVIKRTKYMFKRPHSKTMQHCCKCYIASEFNWIVWNACEFRILSHLEIWHCIFPCKKQKNDVCVEFSHWKRNSNLFKNSCMICNANISCSHIFIVCALYKCPSEE